MKRTNYTVYNFDGIHPNGKWKRSSVRKRFNNIKDFYNYLLQKDNLNIFGVTIAGLFIVTTESKKKIKSSNPENIIDPLI